SALGIDVVSSGEPKLRRSLGRSSCHTLSTPAPSKGRKSSSWTCGCSGLWERRLPSGDSPEDAVGRPSWRRWPVPGRDAFDEAYGSGVPRPIRRASGAPSPPAGRLGPPPPAPAGADLPEQIAVGGSILEQDGSMARGWVVIDGDRITAVRSTKPKDVEHAIATDGVILPGLIDLHGHPEYNVFAAWEPPKTYINRGQWRGSPEYAQLVKEPWHALTSGGKSVSVKTAMTRYAEGRAAVAGVTAIQGASKDYPKKAEALVRNVDLLIFG